MIDFVEEFYRVKLDDKDGYEVSRAKRKALSLILPTMIKDRLTEQQSLCIRYKYILGKNQKEIANTLHISQPTVSRHINVAKEILNNELKYCWAAMSVAIDEYDRLVS